MYISISFGNKSVTLLHLENVVLIWIRGGYRLNRRESTELSKKKKKKGGGGRSLTAVVETFPMMILLGTLMGFFFQTLTDS